MMGTAEKFYTEEQREALSEKAQNSMNRHRGMSESTGLMMLDALGEQQNTLQRIESLLSDREKEVYGASGSRTGKEFIVLDFSNTPITRIAFAETRQIADELAKLGLEICHPLDSGTGESPLYVLVGRG